MITQIIDVNGYWTIKVVYGIRLEDNVEGFTRTDMSKRFSLVLLGKTYSLYNFFNTMIHEAKHVQSHICSYYNIPEDGEQAAYLIGFITEQMFKVFKRFSCKSIT